MQSFPCFELVSFCDWDISEWFPWWEATGRELIEGRMIALKTDPIWDLIADWCEGITLAELHRLQVKKLGIDTSSLPKAPPPTNHGLSNEDIVRLKKMVATSEAAKDGDLLERNRQLSRVAFRERLGRLNAAGKASPPPDLAE